MATISVKLRTCGRFFSDTLALIRHSRSLGGIQRNRILGQLPDTSELCFCGDLWQSPDLALPLCINIVASPPSSTSWWHPSAPGTVNICSVHHQYSRSDSPFHAKTVAVPAFATPAATWSCVLKMVQDAHRTMAPRAWSVSMSTAVWRSCALVR